MRVVAIDGPTGVGKSTTARAIAEALGVPLLLDPVSTSPLLDEYYNGEANPDAALASELAFLRLRADLLIGVPGDGIVVSDFSIGRTGPFSEFLDEPSDRARVLDEMATLTAAAVPLDVLVLLSAPPDVLIERVRSRGRGSEDELTIGHLRALDGHFRAWQSAMREQARWSTEIDTRHWDPRRPDDVEALVGQITRALASSPDAPR
ncbi:MAG: deoxynucleoside kinase [Ilumatobacter sp.]